MAFICECNRLVSEGWVYCPSCGRYAGRIVPEGKELRFAVAPGQGTLKTVRLDNPGHTAIVYRADIDPVGVIDLPDGYAGECRPGGDILRLNIETLPKVGTDLFIRLVTRDGPRSAADPWAEPEERPHDPIPIYLEEVAPSRLVVLPELVFLSDNQRSRQIKLHNEGRDELKVTLPPLPAGISYELPEHRPHLTVNVPGGGVVPVGVVLSASGKDTVAPLRFTPTGGEPVTIQICRNTLSDREVMPAYIVGIDFGTRNSSVFVRRVLGRGTRDEIDAAVKDEQGSARFPSALYRDKDATWYFGSEALRRYEAAGANAGVLVRNVKSLLYRKEERYAEHGRDFRRRSLVIRFLTHIRQKAAEFVQSRWGEDLDSAGALYVCSLPVLDPEKYPLLEEEMAVITREALVPSAFRSEPLENFVRFAPEPLCAALYILLGRDDVGIAHGHHIVVFDSGGGTTDVVLGRVDIGAGARLSFEVIDQVGLSERRQTFGGNDVTRALWKQQLNRVRFEERFALQADIEALIQAAPTGNSPALELAREEYLEAQVYFRYDEAVDPLKIAASTGRHDDADLGKAIPNSVLWDEDEETGLPAVPPEAQYVTALDLAEVVETYLDDVLGPVEDEFFGGPDGIDARFDRAQIDYIFPIGGNSLLSRFQKGLRSLFDVTAAEKLVLLSQKEIMEAVARGAVYYPDAHLSNVASYSLELVQIIDGTARRLWSAPANAALQGLKNRMRPQIPFGHGSIRLELRARAGSQSGVLARAEIAPRSLDDRICMLYLELNLEGTAPELRVRFAINPTASSRPELLFTYGI